MRPRLFYSFNNFLRDKFGQRVHKLSLDGGFNCPNLDGTLSEKGCFFCNNRAFCRFSKEKLSLTEQIAASIKFAQRRFGAKKFIAYFQSFTSTYAEISVLRQRYKIIEKFPDIVGLSVSTRPDCLDKEKLDLLEEFSQRYMVWLECGLQSVHNASLRRANRNHTYQDFLAAVDLAKGRNLYLAAHIILGLPDESKEDMLFTAKAISHLPLAGVKFHCLHLVKNSVWGDNFNKNKFKLLAEDEYVDILVSFLELIPKEWVILRLVSDADKDYLLAPLWINNKAEVLARIKKELEKRGTWQGKLCF